MATISPPQAIELCERSVAKWQASFGGAPAQRIAAAARQALARSSEPVPEHAG